MDINKLSQTELDAFNEGFEDAFNGASDTDNRHPLGSNAHLSWNDGFNSFHEQEDRRARDSFLATPFESDDPKLAELMRMPAAQVAELIQLPLELWPGRCHQVAGLLVRALSWQTAETAYGLDLGPVSRKSRMFGGRAGPIRHGWVVTREGVLVDPTWWVFMASAPHLRFLLPGTREAFEAREHYDEGAESLSEMRPSWPCAGDGDRRYRLKDTAVLAALRLQLSRHAGLQRIDPEFTMQQLSWLCRTRYSTWGVEIAAKLYAEIEALGLGAVIPTDFKTRCRRELRWAAVPA